MLVCALVALTLIARAPAGADEENRDPIVWEDLEYWASFLPDSQVLKELVEGKKWSEASELVRPLVGADPDNANLWAYLLWQRLDGRACDIDGQTIYPTWKELQGRVSFVSDRQALRRHVQASEWGKAASLVRPHVGVDPEVVSYSALWMYKALRGMRDWTAILKARDTERPSVILGRLQKMQEGQVGFSLRSAARSLHSQIMEEYYQLLQSFGSPQKHYPTHRGSVMITNEAKESGYALRWMASRANRDRLKVTFFESNFAGFEYIAIWVHCAIPQDEIIVRVQTGPKGSEASFMAKVKLDFHGWKRVRLCMQGEKKQFQSEGDADWGRVRAIQVEKAAGDRVDIILDELALERDIP